MTERPILFNGAMVRALREGRKTVTRRTAGLAKINAEPDAWQLIGPGIDNDFAQFDSLLKPGHFGFRSGGSISDPEAKFIEVRCPFGAEGDRLWTRETLRVIDSDQGDDPEFLGQFIQYAADGEYRGWTHDEEDGVSLYPFKGKSVPSIHMPRWASRDTLEVISTRPERLQAITEADAIAEGVELWMDSLESPRQIEKWCNYTVRAARSQQRQRPLSADRTGASAYLWDSTTKTLPWAHNPWVWRVTFRRIEVIA